MPRCDCDHFAKVDVPPQLERSYAQKGLKNLMQFTTAKHQPACLVAHDVVNKLSAIIGFCDLLQESVVQQNPECNQRLGLIHDLAQSAAKELVEHLSHRSTENQSREMQEEVV